MGHVRSQRRRPDKHEGNEGLAGFPKPTQRQLVQLVDLGQTGNVVRSPERRLHQWTLGGCRPQPLGNSPSSDSSIVTTSLGVEIAVMTQACQRRMTNGSSLFPP